MQHQYPFCVLHFELNGKDLDVNVHPTKMELRFANQQGLYDFVFRTVREGLDRKEYIPEVTVEEPKKTVVRKIPEKPAAEPAKKAVTPQERNLDYFLAQMRERVKADYANRENKSPYQPKFDRKQEEKDVPKPAAPLVEKNIQESGLKSEDTERPQMLSLIHISEPTRH